MQLTNQEIKDFKSKLKCKQDILDYALEINKEVADDQDRDIVNLYAQSEALKLHMYLCNFNASLCAYKLTMSLS